MPQKEKIISAIQGELTEKYKDSRRKEIAEKCLEVGAEWAAKIQMDLLYKGAKDTVPSDEEWNNFIKNDFNPTQRSALKKECHNYIKNRVKVENTGFLFTIVLVAAVSWITQKILNLLFDSFINERS